MVERAQGEVKDAVEEGYLRAKKYTQIDEIVPKSDSRIVARILYFKYQYMGHFADFCLEIVEA